MDTTRHQYLLSNNQAQQQQRKDWQPIVGIDTSVWHYDPIRQKNTLKSDFINYD